MPGLLLASRPRQSAPAPDPTSIFSWKLMSWHRGDLGVTLSGGDVTTWDDSSGHGHTFTGGANKPSTGTLGGQAALYFDATNSERLTLSGSGYGSPTALHVIRVMARNADPPATTARTGLDDWGTSAAKSHIPFTDGTIYDSTGGATRATVGNPGPSLATLCTYESISTGSKFDARLDGAVIYSGGSLGVAVATTPWIGGGSHGAYMDGYLAEVIVLQAEADSTERAAWASYVLGRYGLVIV